MTGEQKSVTFVANEPVSLAAKIRSFIIQILVNKPVLFIGIGMKSQSGVAQKMFDTLAEKSINLKVISTSEIKISVLIDKKNTKKALECQL